MTEYIHEKLFPVTDEARAARAVAAWKASPSQSNERLSQGIIGAVVEVMLGDFVSIYRCATGHEIKDTYAKALKHDILIAVEAAAKAEMRAEDQTAQDAWVLQRNDFPHAVYLTEAAARAECERQRSGDAKWREESRHVADVKVFWNVYKANLETGGRR